jgi:hypothetical protein
VDNAERVKRSRVTTLTGETDIEKSGSKTLFDLGYPKRSITHVKA